MDPVQKFLTQSFYALSITPNTPDKDLHSRISTLFQKALNMRLDMSDDNFRFNFARQLSELSVEQLKTLHEHTQHSLNREKFIDTLKDDQVQEYINYFSDFLHSYQQGSYFKFAENLTPREMLKKYFAGLRNDLKKVQVSNIDCALFDPSTLLVLAACYTSLLQRGRSCILTIQSLTLDAISRLETLPEWIHHLSNLTKLTISNCGNLRQLHLTHPLSKLTHLTIFNCMNLSQLPSSIFQSRLLIEFHLSNCTRLTEFPVIDFCNSTIDCSDTVPIPTGFKYCTNLNKIIITGCSSLGYIPQEIMYLAISHQLELQYSKEDFAPNGERRTVHSEQLYPSKFKS